MSFGTVRLIVLGLVFGTLLLAGGLVGLGLAVPLAVALALLLVGGAALAIERRLGRQAPAFGVTFLSLSGIAGIVAAVHALPQVNGWVVGLGTLALEIAALIGVVKLYRRLLGQAGSVFRRRLAARRSWRYEPEATVPVPGPRTAPRLKSVPNAATSTTGRDVLHASANGLAVTVFDRTGARGRQVQTVWLVHLPMPLPSVEGEHTDSPDFARALMTSDVRRVTGTRGFPMRWWIEGRYLCCTADDGARPPQVEEYVDRLTGLASRFPWPDLAPYALR
jgi:hypothetical protein